MRDSVKAKLDSIAHWFPPERIARSKERITRLWSGQPPLDRHPMTYGPVSIEYYDKADCFEDRLDALLGEMLFHGPLNDDFIPHLFPGCRQSAMPSLFGAEEIVLDGDCTCRKIMHEPADFARLPLPQIAPGSVAARWLAMQEYFVEETGGRLPVSVVDMQGPMDACGQIWSYDELFLSAYEDPELCHAILDRLADGFILFWQRQKELLGERFVGTHLWGFNWVPPELGASLSADSLVMVSPEFYGTFYRPPIEKIGRAFGGISIHSCGNFAQNIPALCATPFVKGINAGQMTIADMVKAGMSPDTVIIAFGELAQALEIGQLRRDHGLRIELALNGMPWPWADGIAKAPDQWTTEELDTLRRAEDAAISALNNSPA